MNTPASLSIGDMASALGGAGLTYLATELQTALILIGIAVCMKILVALLNKKGIEVSSQSIG